ncbi:MAG: hypothetical protein LC790_10580 [Actinobacteria bacterium]|nr:hypothetical protein [Actinomycetota bacterium]
MFPTGRHSVYDLASALWQLDTRGASFIELRARLYALFLPGQSPPTRQAPSRRVAHSEHGS